MEDSLIDASIDEPVPSIYSEDISSIQNHSGFQNHSSLQDHPSLRDRIYESRKRNEECYRVLEDLLNENEILKAENISLKAQLTAQGQATNAPLWEKQEDSPQVEYLTKVEGLTQQLRDAQLSMETAPFVLVLIDGNAHTFVNSLLRERASGGSEAGLMLRDEIADRIYKQYAAKDWRIVTKLYLDIEGLITRRALPPLYTVSRLRGFFVGFTQVQSTFDVVDTGHDPHGNVEANNKIKEMLELFVRNVQCKHIFYACAPDPASLTTLDAYRDNFITASSITLIKSKPLEGSELFLPFEIIELPSLFRGDEERFDEGSLGSVQETSAERHERSRTTMKTKRSRSRGRERNRPITALGSTWGPEEKIVLLNIDNQRVDSQLGKLDPKAIDSFNKRMAKRKVCMWYHLDNQCLNGSGCKYSHGPRLEAGELDVLRMKVRQNVCQGGSECRSPKCFFGHMCAQVWCTRGDMCKFRHLHDISRDAITVYKGFETETSTPAELNSDDSSHESITDNDLNGHESITDKDLDGLSVTKQDPPNPIYQTRPSILAPRNPNVAEQQDQSKIEEIRKAANLPYIRYFERRNHTGANL